MELRETMWAEMKPDVYSGDSCEQHRPNWYSYADGDKQGGDDGNELSLNAEAFPPGTKIVVSEPVCPSCGETPGRSFEPEEIMPEHGDGKPFKEFLWRCGCDYDWRGLASNEYS